ncbi:hypothetical protein ACTFIR_012039 [Dictyostelium discoideum]
MSTSKKIKTDNNNNKIFQDIIDFEILISILNFLLISNKNNNKRWYNFISLTISNNIINNKSFEHWLKINNKLFTEDYKNQNQYDKNNLFFNNKYKIFKISFNKEFSIVKIKESIINDYFKFNLFLHNITIDDFKEIKNKFENNQLVYNRIVVNKFRYSSFFINNNGTSLFRIHKYISNENSEIISNLFKILELNFDFWLDRYRPDSEEEEDHDHDPGKGNKKCTVLYFNNLSIDVYNDEEEVADGDEEIVKIFKIFKGNNLIFDGSHAYCESEILKHFNHSALFDPDYSVDFVEARHLIKVNQFENLHSITIPINSYQILSNLSDEMGFHSLHHNNADPGNSDNIKSELNQMINSLNTCKSLKNLIISSVKLIDLPISFYYKHGESNHEILVNNINQTIESYSNSFQPLFSELNTSIERIEFNSMGLLNINTFSNLLNNKSIKYLYLYDSDFIVYLPKPTGDNSRLHFKPISINQYLFDNIFSSPLTSIRHYRIKFIESKQLKFIFNLILNNIFKLQLYSLIFEFDENKLIGEFVLEFKNLINNISTQQQQQQQQSKNINLKEIKIKIKDVKKIDEEYIQELNNINNPYFTTVIKNLEILSKKWYNFISLTISNNIINYKSFEYWLKTNFIENSFIENYDNNQNQYDKNNLIFNYKEDKQYKISFNKKFSIVKIKESIINDYFKFNLFLNNITIDDFIEMKNKFENNQLLYNRIVVSVDTDICGFPSDILFTIHEYVSNENSEIVSNLFKILELNFDFWLDYGYCPHSEEEEEECEGNNKKCREIYLNNLSIAGKNIIYDGSNIDESDTPTHINYSALFDPDNSGQQVESIKVKNEYGNEALHLIKVNQFENLHSITIPINSFQILSNLSEEMGFGKLYRKNNKYSSDSDNIKSELNQMINSFITSKSLKNLNISSVNSICYLPIKKYDGCDHENFVNNINKTIELFSNSFQPLFSELNTSIERIEFDCCGLLNINTFSNLLNNKSIKYLYLNGDSDFIVYSSKPKGNGRGSGGSRLHLEPISINQYLFDNIFSSPLTSIRHYKINFIESNEIKFIFNLILIIFLNYNYIH